MAQQSSTSTSGAKILPRRLGRTRSAYIGTLLYFATWFLEIPGLVARLILASFCVLPFICATLAGVVTAIPLISLLTPWTVLESLWQAIGVEGWGWGYFGAVFLIAGWNMVTSFFTLVGVRLKWFNGDGFMRFYLGARRPSQREREMVLTAFEEINAATKGLVRSPGEWYVVDDLLPIQPNAYVVGGTLYLSRELIRSQHLVGVLAHELGHLNSLIDGQLTLALNQFRMFYTYLMEKDLWGTRQAASENVNVEQELTEELKQQGMLLGRAGLGCGGMVGLLLLALAGGGLGLFLLNPLWVWYWREREYFADNWVAVNCGPDITQQLIDYLEMYQQFDTATPFFMGNHPYTELRIDELLPYVG